jgi:hypothetical protein
VHRLVALLSVVLLLLLTSCVSLQQQKIEVTPGTVPPEIQGARWPDMPVSYCTVRDDQGGFVDYQTFVRLLQQAISQWGVPTAYSGDCGHAIEAGDGTNEVGWGDLGAPSNLNEAGNTNIRYRSTPGRGTPDIVEADITIERTPAAGRDTEDCLFTTLLHETGHLLGVQHLDASTVMSPVISDCIQELTPDDQAAIHALYGD